MPAPTPPGGDGRRGNQRGGLLPNTAFPRKAETKSMARKILNRKELRAEGDAAKVAAAKKPAAKKSTPRKSRAKVVKEVRQKLFWGVFDQSMKRKFTYAHDQRKAAEKKAAEMTASSKVPHFAMRYKEDIKE
jgi:hypothetical protein